MRVGKGEVPQPANSLINHGTGVVGLLLTRNGMPDGTRWTNANSGCCTNMLIIGPGDEDYRQMLRV